MNKAEILAQLKAQKVIALIRADNADNLLGCARALLAGGLGAIDRSRRMARVHYQHKFTSINIAQPEGEILTADTVLPDFVIEDFNGTWSSVVRNQIEVSGTVGVTVTRE